MAKCKQCSNEFKSKRSTAKYCSAVCCKLAFLSVPHKLPITYTENAKEVANRPSRGPGTPVL